MPIAPTIPADLAAIISKAGLDRLDWPALFQADTISESDSRSLRQLALAHPRGYRLQGLLRAALPEQWVRYGAHDMLVCPRDNHTDFIIWMSGHAPEPASIAALSAAVVEEPCLILDIGANCGSYTLPLAATAVAGSTVLAFEPNPVMAARLRQNVERNGYSDRVTIHQIAISNTEGEAALFLAASNFGEATLNAQKTASGPTVSVPVSLLERFVSPDEPRPVVIKIDIEGHEDRALVPFLKSRADHQLPQVLLIETRHKRNWRMDLTGQLKRHNYHSIFKIEGNTLYLLGG